MIIYINVLVGHFGYSFEAIFFKWMDNYTSLALTVHRTDDDPVTWNSVLRLVVLTLVSTCGSIGGIFVISGVVVVEPLQTRGNIYLVNFALGHLLVTALVLPSYCVAILAGIPNESTFCTFQWLTTSVCFIVSVLSAMFVSIDNFLGLGQVVTYNVCCTKGKIIFSVFFSWMAAIGFAVGQHVMEYGPVLCQLTNNPRELTWLPYQIAMGCFLILLPLLLCIWYFTRSVIKLKSFKQEMTQLDNPMAYVLTDEHLLRSNIVIFILMLLMWMPLVVSSAINVVMPIDINLISTSWWVAVTNSCIYSYVYAATNKEFREAFNKLFYYCCCKSHITISRRQRDMHRSGNGIGLRVHIIPSLNIYAQRKENFKESKSPYDL
ncbi:melatonin receptor type 1A-like isoform X2 [Centruroides sculpturatus]|uniref:melatonin receptor type 1A-like isoform X1 n=1 Tax=Centruroides sculpturatus TaxID=218467 RepID=UPI000C6ECD09|nr:melatonin receptor type 1A-like isoform X1 [Centruroides sculpturatus]XP_023237094.1 melatonin receptor type 1A-like isoform X2 [Centruroides sculpturatus]